MKTSRPAAGGPLTPAQRREVLASDPVTGELKGGATTRAALVAKGLAVPYGRVGAHYLTEAGRALRDRLDEETRAEDTPPEPANGNGAGRAADTFRAATGDEAEGPEDAAGRSAAVAHAWASVLEIRRLAGTRDADTPGRPALWERNRLAWAVSLALEAAGVPPSATDASGRRTRAGYRVLDSGEPGTVRVEWCGPARSGAAGEAGRRLDGCVRELGARGWESLRYRGARGGHFLLVSPSSPRDVR